MTWQHQRLVRVRWRNRETQRIRSFVAGVTARDQNHAEQIADAVMCCMVPSGLPLDIIYQTALLSRNPIQSDMHSEHTVWERFEAYSINKRPAIEYRKRRTIGASTR